MRKSGGRGLGAAVLWLVSIRESRALRLSCHPVCLMSKEGILGVNQSNELPKIEMS